MGLSLLLPSKPPFLFIIHGRRGRSQLLCPGVQLCPPACDRVWHIGASRFFPPASWNQCEERSDQGLLAGEETPGCHVLPSVEGAPVLQPPQFHYAKAEVQMPQVCEVNPSSVLSSLSYVSPEVLQDVLSVLGSIRAHCLPRASVCAGVQRKWPPPFLYCHFRDEKLVAP